MKNIYLFFCCVAVFSSSCKKAELDPLPPTSVSTTTTAPAAVKSRGYITVECETCKVEYGMPDQYKGLNITGSSDKLYFDYTDEYYLKTYITALQRSQRLILNIYNKSGTKIFSDTTTQSTKGFWDTYVLVRDNKSS